MQEQAATTSDLLEFMLDHADAWLIMVGTDLTVTAWNETARRESGYDRTDFSTLPELVDLLVPEAADRARMLAAFDDLGAIGERVTRLRTPIVTRTGAERTIAWNVDFVPDPGSTRQMLAVAVGIDMTDRLNGERALQRNETIHRLLLENLQEGIWWIDPEGRSLYANTRLAELLGVHATELVGRQIDGFLPVGFDALASPVSQDAKLRRADGSIAFVHVSGGPLDATRDGVHGALLSIVDLSVQRRLSEEHALLVQAVTQASDSIVITDEHATIRYVNPAFTRVTGYSESEAIGKNSRILQSGEHDDTFYKELWGQISSGGEWKGVFRNRRSDGTLYSEEASISPVHDEDGTITGYIGVKRDVTRELELQEYLQRSQKLQAVGTLAGGVAHDFNNILMAIVGYAELARSAADPDSPLARHLESIRAAAKRAGDLPDQLLTFSRGGAPEGDPIDMTDAVSEAVAMLRATTPTTVAITTELEETRHRVGVGRTEIVQVVMNLGLNAVAAIDPDANGHITITLHAEPVPQPSLVLTVSDDGIGMDDETLARVFEPFFSTRPVGQGTGMGLAVVHGIISGAGGTIRAETPIVGYTGYSETVDEARAAASGIDRLLRKPLDTDELVGVLRTILQEEKNE